jgi:hypothetical protein
VVKRGGVGAVFQLVCELSFRVLHGSGSLTMSCLMLLQLDGRRHGEKDGKDENMMSLHRVLPAES